ncbi:hypothetical protein [Streptomyces microflavus]|uniref:hypothetical protein n=1 Tax=Streptomyces microflavus TaxID=1919 RepID=UPI00340F9AA3
MTTPETFGHEPIEVGGDWPNRAVVCARCRWNYPRMGSRPAHRRYAPWPCTSAIVLGLAPHTTTPAPAAG